MMESESNNKPDVLPDKIYVKPIEICDTSQEPEFIRISNKIDKDSKDKEISDMSSTNLDISSTPHKTQATAFTIDFNDGKTVDASKYKTMMDKFQKRHKRGVSLSKLEGKLSTDSTMSRSPMSGRMLRIESSVSRNSGNNTSRSSLPNDKIRKSSLNTSTSLKSQISQSISFHEPANLFTHSSQLHNSDSKSLSPQTSWHETSLSKSDEENLRSLPEMGTQNADLQSPLLIKKQLCALKDIYVNVTSEQDLKNDDSSSSISETGTYTIENDTYTEEQKAKMNIDQALIHAENENIMYTECVSKDYYDTNEHSSAIIDSASNEKLFENSVKSKFIQYDDVSSDSPIQYSNIDSSTEKKACTEDLKLNKVSPDKNVLEISYCYEPQKEHKSRTRTSVLEKLKKRVRNISERTMHKSTKTIDKNLDLGSFTSVTTSGVLSSKGNEVQNKYQYIPHELEVLLKRKNSLTKSQIDTSDYLQKDVKHNEPDENQGIMHDKHALNASYQNTEISTEFSPNHSKADKTLKSFENSWIYEWAKSASEHNRKQLGLEHLPESCNSLKPAYYKLDNDTKINNNVMQHLVQNKLARREMSLPLCGVENNRLNEVTTKLPPRHPSTSPTKIPSPISTLTRPRSRNSFSLSGSTTEINSPNVDTESYLRNTEDVINILSHSLSNQMELGQPPSLPYSDSQNMSPMHSLDNSLSPKISPRHVSYVTISPAHKHNNAYRTIKSESSPTSPKYSSDHSIARPRYHTRHFSFDNSVSPIGISTNKIMNNSLSHKNDLYDKSYKVPYEHSHNLNPTHDYRDKNHGMCFGKISVNDITNKDSCIQSNLDHLPPKPLKCFINKHDKLGMKHNIDQTPLLSSEHSVYVSKDNWLNKQNNSFNKDNNCRLYSKNEIVTNKFSKHQNSPNSSPIRRSSSFSTQPTFTSDCSVSTRNKQVTSKQTNKNIQRSASNANVKKCLNIQNRSGNNTDNFNYDRYEDNFSDNNKNESESDSENENENINVNDKKKETITNTRCNRAFSLRRARLEAEKTESVKTQKNSPKVTANKNAGKVEMKNNASGSVASTDLQRKPIRSSFRDRASMPRDSSLQRLKQNLDLNHDISMPTTVKKNSPAVQPRYMDISKYKSPASGSFLRKDESKSYLETRSMSGNSAKNKNLARNDNTRLSLRSVKASKGVIKKEIVKNPTKEQELANWRRRATYDPMKAAAEGKKKAELAKRVTSSNIMTQSYNENDDSSTNSGGAVLRSQSYHGTAALDWLSASSPKRKLTGSRTRVSESHSETSDEEITLS